MILRLMIQGEIIRIRKTFLQLGHDGRQTRQPEVSHAELQTFFNATIPKNKGIYAALSNGHNVREALWEARDNLFLLEMDSGGDAFDIVNISQTQVRSLMVELRDQFNFIIIDCTSHKESVFTGLGLVEADKVVVWAFGDTHGKMLFWASDHAIPYSMAAGQAMERLTAMNYSPPKESLCYAMVGPLQKVKKSQP